MRTSQRTSLLDESRWNHFPTDDRGNALREKLAVIEGRSGTIRFAASADIDVYDASGNIANKSEFPMLRKKRQYKHRNGDDCVTSIFSDASKIGTVLKHTPSNYY
ncbi:hypothetical protein AVEN_228313-1 [Araneus ventricosus]|uniref:Uncharacterized protein n=1 Tax=Araneus ventricosus TaxID=182803 RepID=A0A4Y2PAW3_ARAVE|nr:hypothetical protein AVEN_228313-1 [Araneus ventricosus]